MTQRSRPSAANILPPLVEDELVASYWKRVRELNFNNNSRTLAGDVLAGAWRELSPGLPTHLESFQEAAGVLLQLDDEQLLLQHTLFGLYAAGLPEERQRSLRLRMLKSSRGPRQPCAPIANIDRSTGCVMVCSKCQSLSLKETGAATWRRIHNAPGIEICPIHFEPLGLMIDGIAFRYRTARSLLLTDVRISNDLRLSSVYQTVCGMSVTELRCFREDLLHRVRLAVASGAGRQKGYAETAKRFCDAFKTGFVSPELTRLTSDADAIGSALHAMLRSRPNVHPTWVALTHLAVATEEKENKVIPAKALASAPLEGDLVDLLRRSASLTSASVASGVSIGTLSTLARKYGLDFSYRPSVMTDGTRTLCLSRLTSGVGMSDIAKDLMIGIQSVYRALASAPEVRQTRDALLREARLIDSRARWLALLAADPNASSTQLRRQAAALWSWLYRNDRCWLSSSARGRGTQSALVLASPRRVSRLDASQTTRLKDAKARRLANPNCRRVSATFLIGAVGGMNGSGTSSRAISKAARALAETEFDYVSRRLFQGAAGLQARGMTVSPSSLLRSARIRSSTAENAGVDVDAWLAKHRTRS